MGAPEKRLTDLPVYDLLGMHFFIPHYQRGYRWTRIQVEALLNDIWSYAAASPESNESGRFYCLQPVVVKRRSWVEDGQPREGWEVIDGQQRLTTLYVILQYLAAEYLKVDSLADEYGAPLFTMYYETRPTSATFLKSISESNEYPDYYYIWQAKQAIGSWFKSDGNLTTRTERERFLGALLGKRTDERSVRVIWYHPDSKGNVLDDEKDSIELFTRLNMGKIPLTNAELVKALFLCSSSRKDESEEVAHGKKVEIAHVWDTIEQQLGNKTFWAFITNQKSEKYPTKIELVLDLIAGKSAKEREPFFTFFHFLKEVGRRSPWDIWIDIERYFQTLCEWQSDKDLYHKVGYLVAIGADLSVLLKDSMKCKKNKFESTLDEGIQKSIPTEFEDLSYERSYETIKRILLLFNVESVRRNESTTDFYPFQFHKGALWSLEHIHAQNSEALDRNKKEQWLEWLHIHKDLIESLATDEQGAKSDTSWQTLLEELNGIDEQRLRWERFVQIANRIVDRFSQDADDYAYDVHSLANLALLGQPENAALNNSVFEVKRRAIIDMDKKGAYIPICTRRVFLKYYSKEPSSQQVNFWSPADRQRYLNEIETVLECYTGRGAK